MVEIDTTFLIRGPVSKMSECIGFWGVSAAMLSVVNMTVLVICIAPSKSFSFCSLSVVVGYRLLEIGSAQSECCAKVTNFKRGGAKLFAS
jgi:hypothetical protein